MGQRNGGRTRRREITTTAYYDDQVTEVMRVRGVCRSEAYRHIQLIYEQRVAHRVQLAHMVTAMKNEALCIAREGGGRFNDRVGTIVRAATEVLALL